MSVTVEKLTEEFQTFLQLDATAKTLGGVANAADNELQNTIDVEEAKVNAAQASADQAIAEKQAIKDAAVSEAVTARQKAEAQKHYFGGLLGLTPPTEDPTPDPAEPTGGILAALKPSKN